MEEDVGILVTEVTDSVTLAADEGNIAANEISSRERDKRFDIR